jgi:hypothetical protein
MGFDVGNFVSSASQGIAERAVSGIKDTIDSSLGGGKGYTDLAASILLSGSSLQTISSIASLQFDNFLDKVADDFFGRLKGSITGSGEGRTPQGLPGNLDSNAAGSLKYPSDLGAYAFALQFAKYKRPLPLSRSTDQITQTIYLPLPRELTGGHQMNLDTPSTGLIGSVYDAAQLAVEKDEITKGTGASVAVPGAVVATGAAASRGGLIGRIGKMAAAGALSESIGAIVEQEAGATPNPNLSVTYKGPSLRTFTFTWEFSPNNAQESQMLQKIMEEIQKRSLAAYSVEGSAALLTYPETVKIKVLPSGSGQIGDLMKFKKGMLSAVDINYSPNGIPSFFKGTKAPTFIGLTLSMQEIEYFVSADYGGTNAGGFSTDPETVMNQLKTAGSLLGEEASSLSADFLHEDPPEEGP